MFADVPALSLGAESAKTLDAAQEVLSSFADDPACGELAAAGLVALVIARGSPGATLRAIRALLAPKIGQPRLTRVPKPLYQALYQAGLAKELWSSPWPTTLSHTTDITVPGEPVFAGEVMLGMVATDGAFLYVHSSSAGLYKLGSGLHGTMPGYVYAELPGFAHTKLWLGIVQGKLLFRSVDMAAGQVGALSCDDLSDVGTLQQPSSSSHPSKPALAPIDARSLLCANGRHLAVVQHTPAGVWLWLTDPLDKFRVEHQVRF